MGSFCIILQVLGSISNNGFFQHKQVIKITADAQNHVRIVNSSPAESAWESVWILQEAIAAHTYAGGSCSTTVSWLWPWYCHPCKPILLHVFRLKSPFPRISWQIVGSSWEEMRSSLRMCLPVHFRWYVHVWCELVKLMASQQQVTFSRNINAYILACKQWKHLQVPFLLQVWC